MTDKLYEILKYIEVNGNLYRAMNMKHEVVDSILHFYLNLNFTVMANLRFFCKMAPKFILSIYIIFLTAVV